MNEPQQKGLLPKTILGKWSLGLTATMLALFFIVPSLSNFLYESAPAGNTIWEDIDLRPALALPILFVMVSETFAFLVGLVAIIKQKEQSSLVYVTTMLGALFILFLLAELLFPH